MILKILSLGNMLYSDDIPILFNLFSFDGGFTWICQQKVNYLQIRWQKISHGNYELINTEWDVSDEAALRTIFEKLKTCGGIDANGNNTIDGFAVVTGRVNIDSISNEFLEELNEAFPELIVYVNGEAKFFIRYINLNGEVLYKYIATTGDNVIDPVKTGLIDLPFSGRNRRYQMGI